MANGQQVSEENLEAFLAWVSSKEDDDYREYLYRGKLSRKDIASECGFGKSALLQNPAIRSALESLEDGLRAREILPPLGNSVSEVESKADFPLRNREATQRMRDAQRLNALEQQNAALNAKLGKLEGKLKELNALDDFLVETGRLPR